MDNLLRMGSSLTNFLCLRTDSADSMFGWRKTSSADFMLSKTHDGLTNIAKSILKYGDISPSIESFNPVEIETLFKFKDDDGDNLTWYAMHAANGDLTMKTVYLKLGGDRCVKLLLNKNKLGINSTAAAAITMGPYTENIYKLFKMITSSELETMLSDKDRDGDNTLCHLLKHDFGNSIFPYIYASIGGELFVSLLLEVNSVSKSAIMASRALDNESCEKLIQIIEDIHLESFLVKSTDDDSYNVLYHILTRSDRVCIIKLIYEKLGGERSIKYLSNTKTNLHSALKGGSEGNHDITEFLKIFCAIDLVKVLNLTDQSGNSLMVEIVMMKANCIEDALIDIYSRVGFAEISNLLLDRANGPTFGRIADMCRGDANGAKIILRFLQILSRNELSRFLQDGRHENSAIYILFSLDDQSHNVMKFLYRQIEGKKFSTLLLQKTSQQTIAFTACMALKREHSQEFMEMFTANELQKLFRYKFKTVEVIPLLFSAINSDPTHCITTFLHKSIGGSKFVTLLLIEPKNGRSAIAWAIECKCIQPILEILAPMELKRLLGAQNNRGQSTMHLLIHTLPRNSMAANIITYTCSILGFDECTELLLHKNSQGFSVVGELADFATGDQILHIMRNFTDQQLGEMLIDEHGTTSLITLYHYQEKLGIEICIALLLREKSKAQPVITTSSHIIQSMMGVLKMFEQSLEMFLTRKDSSGRMIIYHVLSTGTQGAIDLISKNLGCDKTLSLLLEPDSEACSTISNLYDTCQNPKDIYDIIAIFNSKDQAYLLSSASSRKPDNCRLIKLIFSSTESTIKMYEAMGATKCLRMVEQFDPSVRAFEGLLRAFSCTCPEKVGSFLRSTSIMTHSKSFRNMLKDSMAKLELSFSSQLKAEADWSTDLHELHSWEWLKQQIINDNPRYVLADQPSILVVFNTKGRPGAHDEASSIISSLEAIGLKIDVKQDLSREAIFDAIKGKQQHDSSQICQLVVIMTHGKKGHIFDNSGEQEIPMESLEKAMCPESHKNSPKVLIMQCCQGFGNGSSASNFTSHLGTQSNGTSAHEDTRPSNDKARLSSYVPTSKDFLAIMSCVSGQPSVRNVFIPLLAKEIKISDKDLNSVFKAVHEAMTDDRTDQIPILATTLRYNIYLKQVFNTKT